MPTVKIYRVSVTGDNHSYVQWTECEGQTPPKQLIDSRVRSITFEAQGTGITPGVNCSISKSAAATIEMIGDGNSDCSGIGSTLYPTTTTTTTTYAPINFTITPTCSSPNISGIITVSSFSGGNGTYSTVAIGNSNGTSYNAPTTNLSGATSYQWTGLTNGEWFVTLRDSLGNHAVKSAIVGCGVCSFNGGSVSYYGASSTTTTSTTTTTTTTAAPTTTTTTTAAPTTTTTTAAPTTTTTTAAPTTTTTTAAPTTTTTTTTTTTAAPTTTTTTTAASTSIFVYAKEVLGLSAQLQYNINGGSEINLATVDSVNCTYIGEITGVSVGNTVSFSTTNTGGIKGQASAVCPGGAASAESYLHTVTAGPNYVGLLINETI